MKVIDYGSGGGVTPPSGPDAGLAGLQRIEVRSRYLHRSSCRARLRWTGEQGEDGMEEVGGAGSHAPEARSNSGEGPQASPSPAGGTSFPLLVVAGQAIFGEALADALRARGWTRVHACSPEMLSDACPPVALVGLDLRPSSAAPTLIASLAQRGVSVLALWDGADRYVLAEALEAGATGTIDTHGSLNRAEQMIRDATEGVVTLSMTSRAELLSELATHRAVLRSQVEPFDRLTPRERQVLGLLMIGRSTEEIAAFRIVSVATIRTQIRNVLAKLQVKSQLAAVALAVSAGWQPHRLSTVPDPELEQSG